jgi:hypothetical protein
MILIEDRIKREFGAVRAFVALHPYWSVLAAVVIGAVCGHLL